MNVEVSAHEVQGGAAAPAENATATPPAPVRVPRSDAEAEQMERDAAAAANGNGEPGTPAAGSDPAKDDAGKKKGQASAFINSLKEERRALRNRTAELEAENERLRNGGSSAARASTGASTPADTNAASGFNEPEPTLEDFEFDQSAFLKAWSRWDRARETAETKAHTERTQSREEMQNTFDTYEDRIADFAAEHDDFQEVVTAIQYPMSEQVQLAIMRHERGPEIAYFLGKNDDEAFNLASVNPALAEKAVERLASRMTAAQSKAPSADEPASQTPSAPVVPGLKPTSKPVSKAPAPTPTLSGRSAGDIPDEKLSDDEWYRRQVERERKR